MVKMSCMQKEFLLNTGKNMPLIGFGTYQIRNKELIRNVLDYAFEAGYRQIDTAAVYGNEAHIGAALKELLPKYKLKREHVFITSKLDPNDQGPSAYEALQKSVKNLDCEYLDLYLIHWPGAKYLRGSDPNNRILRDESWSALVKGVKDGLTRAIGVSNYTVTHLKQLIENNKGIMPAVNQVEFHPEFLQTDLLQFCRDNNILFQAYSSLGGTGNSALQNNSTIVDISMKLNRTPAQVLLRWAFQQNVGIIPKARSKEHIQDNTKLDFDISDDFMKELSSLEQDKYAWDPETIV